MPKNNMRKTRRNGRSGRRQRRKQGETVFSGSLEIPVSASTVVSAVTLDSLVTAGSPFLATLGDCFNMYRFEDLQLTLYPLADHTTADGSLAVGYQNEITDTRPTSLGQVLTLPYNRVVTDGQTVPVKFDVPRRALLQNQQKFWRTQLPSQTNTGTGLFATSDLWESVQGVFWFIASAALNLIAVLKYTIRLTQPSYPALTPRPQRTEALLGWHPMPLLGDRPHPDAAGPDRASHPSDEGYRMYDIEDSHHALGRERVAPAKAFRAPAHRPH